MQDFIIIDSNEAVEFTEKVEEKLIEGYNVVSSGQYDKLLYPSNSPHRPQMCFWAHLTKN